MIALATAVTLFGALSLINLLLTLGLVRRLRQFTAQPRPAGADLPVPELDLGGPLPLAGQVGQDGRPLLIGFFSAGCKACPDHIAPFRAYAEAFPGDAVAILEGGPQATAKYVPGLGDGIRTISNATEAGLLSEAIGLRAWPSFVVVDETGRVRSKALSVNALDPMALNQMALNHVAHPAGVGGR
jgi:hypothetical protein